MSGPKGKIISVLGQGSGVPCEWKEWERKAQQLSVTPVTHKEDPAETPSLLSFSGQAVSWRTL